MREVVDQAGNARHGRQRLQYPSLVPQPAPDIVAREVLTDIGAGLLHHDALVGLLVDGGEHVAASGLVDAALDQVAPAEQLPGAQVGPVERVSASNERD